MQEPAMTIAAMVSVSSLDGETATPLVLVLCMGSTDMNVSLFVLVKHADDNANHHRFPG